jgi:hypothetical protein
MGNVGTSPPISQLSHPTLVLQPQDVSPGRQPLQPTRLDASAFVLVLDLFSRH